MNWNGALTDIVCTRCELTAINTAQLEIELLPVLHIMKSRQHIEFCSLVGDIVVGVRRSWHDQLTPEDKLRAQLGYYSVVDCHAHKSKWQAAQHMCRNVHLADISCFEPIHVPSFDDRDGASDLSHELMKFVTIVGYKPWSEAKHQWGVNDRDQEELAAFKRAVCCYHSRVEKMRWNIVFNEPAFRGKQQCRRNKTDRYKSRYDYFHERYAQRLCTLVRHMIVDCFRHAYVDVVPHVLVYMYMYCACVCA